MATFEEIDGKPQLDPVAQMPDAVFAGGRASRELIMSRRRKLIARQAWIIWGTAVAFVILIMSLQAGYSVVNPLVQHSTGVTIAQIGLIAATYNGAYAFFQLFGGALLDELGAKKVLPIAMGLVAVGTFMFANADGFFSLLLSQIVMAAGSCVGFVGAGFVGGRWFGMARYGLMFGLVQMASAAGGAVATNSFAWAADALDWRSLFNLLGLLGLVLFIAGLRIIRDPEKRRGSVGFHPVLFFGKLLEGLREVAANRTVWAYAVWGGLSFGAMLALGVVWGRSIVMAQGVSASGAALSVSMLWVGLTAGSAIVPKWSERMRSRKIPNLVGSVIKLATFLAVLYVPDLGLWGCMAMYFMFGFADATHVLAYTGASDVVHPRRLGMSAAFVNCAMFLTGGILMGLPGDRLQAMGLSGMNDAASAGLGAMQHAMLPITIALVVALLLNLFMRETHPARR